MAVHRYNVTVSWTGNRGTGTSGYRDYARTHVVSTAGKPDIPGSSDPHFRGEAERWSPEDLLVVSLSQCHMLWYLHLAAVNGVVVTDYVDLAEGTMSEHGDDGGHFTGVVLRPRITVTEPSMVERAAALHHDANAKCYIAQSVNFPVGHEATIVVAG